jgi:hypothetical protein
MKSTIVLLQREEDIAFCCIDEEPKSFDPSCHEASQEPAG